jgi:hypothetical protein
MDRSNEMNTIQRFKLSEDGAWIEPDPDRIEMVDPERMRRFFEQEAAVSETRALKVQAPEA